MRLQNKKMISDEGLREVDRRLAVVGAINVVVVRLHFWS